MTSAVSSVLSTLLGNLSGSSSSSSSSGTGTSSSSSSSSSTATTASGRTPAYELALSQAAQNQNTIGLLTNLQTLGQEFSSTALGLATSQVNSNVSTSDGKIASISTVTNNNYAVNVSQLASAQTLTSSAFSSSAKLGTTGDTMVLQLGEWSNSSFTASGSSATTITVGTNTLSGIASAINTAKAGVSASLVSVTGGSVELKLTGNTTGVFSGFSLSTSSDLTSLEYNSNAQSLSLTQAATDASYTVNGSLFTSPTNSAVPVTTGVDINLEKVGSVMISQVNTPTQLLSSAQSLVSYVNNLVQGIYQVQSSLGTADEGTTSQYINSMTQIGYKSLNGTNALTTLSDIGLNMQPDGTIQFNQTTFTTAYGKDPTNASFVLSQAALAFANVSNQNAGSNGSIQERITNLNELQVALVYGSKAAAQAAQGSASTTSSKYGAETNPWAGTNFYQG